MSSSSSKKTKEEISKALIGQYETQIKEAKKEMENLALTVDADEDYEKSRETLHNLIDQSEAALESMMNLASETEHPRSFEVLGGMMKTTAEITNQLMDLQKRRHELDQLNRQRSSEENGGTGGGGNTNVFVGSTADLQRMLNNQKKKKEKPAEEEEDIELDVYDDDEG